MTSSIIEYRESSFLHYNFEDKDNFKKKFNETANRVISQESGPRDLEEQDQFYNLILEACKKKRWDIISACTVGIFEFMETAEQSAVVHFLRAKDYEIIGQIIDNNLYRTLAGLNESSIGYLLVREGDVSALRFFGEKGHVNMCTNDSRGANLLVCAIEENQKNLIPLFLEYRINPRGLFNHNGLSLNALAFAVYSGSIECFDTLVECLKSSNYLGHLMLATHSDVGNVLHLAICANQLRMLENLLTKHYSLTKNLITSQDPYNRTPFMLAAYYGKKHMLQALIWAGANFLAEDEKGYNALHYAVLGKQIETVLFLLHCGMNVNSIALQGITPKMIAETCFKDTGENEFHQIQLLLENFSDISRDHNHTLPFQESLPPDSLVLQGSMLVSPYSYAKAITELEDRKIVDNLRRVGGNSHAALAATLLALGDNGYRISQELLDISAKMTKLSKEQILYIQQKLAFHSNDPKNPLYSYLQKKKPLSSSTNMRKKIGSFIKEYTGSSKCTFGELANLVHKRTKNAKTNYYFKHLHVTVINVKSKKILQINSEEKKWGNLLIVDVIVSAIAFPLFMRVQNLRERSNQSIKNTNLFCMGGWGLTEPAIQMFDQSKFVFNSFGHSNENNYQFNARVLGVQFNSKISSENQMNNFLIGKPLFRRNEGENSIGRKRMLKIRFESFATPSNSIASQIKISFCSFFEENALPQASDSSVPPQMQKLKLIIAEECRLKMTPWGVIKSVLEAFYDEKRERIFKMFF